MNIGFSFFLVKGVFSIMLSMISHNLTPRSVDTTVISSHISFTYCITALYKIDTGNIY